jgi:UDP-N-acetylmuramoylalanine--D-glutamate ligase
MNLRNKRVTVVGLGRSGFAAAWLLSKKGARVLATDGSRKEEVLLNAGVLEKLGVRTETGGHTADFVEKSVLVVTSPGVPRTSLPLALAKKKKIPVVSEIEAASWFCRGTVVGITGSNGKTTTSHLIHRIFVSSGKHSILCGNVGRSFAGELPGISQKTIVVLELSSFQLEGSPTFRPKVAVVLNISRNHIDRHGTFASYAAAKEKIFKNQRKEHLLILNYEDVIVRKMARKSRAKVIFFSKRPLAKGVFFREGKIVVKPFGKEVFTLETKNFKLLGEHNLENILASVAVAAALKIAPAKIQKALDDFRTLEHRIEPLGAIRGVKFFNDSKSTTVESTRAAISSMPGPVVLVAGGRDKGADFSKIEPLLVRRLKNAVLYGEARETMSRSWKAFRRFGTEEKFADAVRQAFRRAAPGDCVLLSPMCTSFDQFRSFEERGAAFKKIFKQLRKHGTAS